MLSFQEQVHNLSSIFRPSSSLQHLYCSCPCYFFFVDFFILTAPLCSSLSNFFFCSGVRGDPLENRNLTCFELFCFAIVVSLDQEPPLHIISLLLAALGHLTSGLLSCLLLHHLLDEGGHLLLLCI
jgi:hypothetical protein